MSTATKPTRRKLHFATLQDLRAEVKKLGESKYVAAGNWNLAQNLVHLTLTMNAAFDGFSFQGPWPLRKFMQLIKKRVLSKTLPAGFKIPPKARKLVPENDSDLKAALTGMQAAITRFEEETPNQPHPFFEQLTKDEWIQFSLRHAELHLGFIVPISGLEPRQQVNN